MKSLIDRILEGYITRHQLKDINLDEFRKIAEKIGNDRNGLGASVADTKTDLVGWILSKMKGGQSWSHELQFKDWDKDPIYDDEIEKILHDNFNFFTTKELTYLAPKKTPKATVKRWLGDDFIGTMENPNI